LLYWTDMKRIFSGITPSSSKGLHLGNYLGMVKPSIGLQNEGECLYFIANMHSLNTVFSPDDVKINTMNIFTEFLAFGIDVKKTIFFVESDIPGIPFLQTILNNMVTVSELKRMHGYKDKLQDDTNPDQIGMGLFSYPVLMAADILLFKPDIIPVGEDQSQHVEIACEIARTFNNRYGDILKIPELSVQKNVARVPGIYGDRKMSKSLGNDIPIFGTEQEIKKQIMSIKTDPARVHPTDPGNPDKNIAFTYFDLLSYEASKLEEMKEKYRKGKIGDVEIKSTFLNFFLEYFADFRTKKIELLKDKERIHEIRIQGAQKANAITKPILDQIRRAIGLI